MRFFLLLILGSFSIAAYAGIGEGRERPVRTTVQEVPIYSYGSTYILGQPPDFMTGVRLQKDNPNPITKIRLKKSWEIKENWLGGSNPHMPRTEMSDRLQAPFLPINLIDEDIETYWTSRGQPTADMEQVWIRLDLPRETMLKSVVLQRRSRPYRVSWQIAPKPEVKAAGDGVPRELTIKVSQDGGAWTTVADQKDYSPADDKKRLEFAFEPRPVKQIWILANQCRLVDCWGFAFSLAGVEAIDTAGQNAASALRGTGVTVSSTADTYTDNRVITDDLWATAWDLGVKWVRVSGWDCPLLWSYVEREEKGKYYIDPKTEQAVTELAQNGINVILPLAYGNYLYSPDGPRKWQKESTDVLELPQPPLTDEAHQAFLAWTRFMVNRFKDRVQYYYLWNEPYQGPPYGWGDPVKYSKWVRDVVKTIKDEYPEAKIAWPTALTKGEFLEGCFKEGIASLFDMTHADLSDPPGIKKRWIDAGFKGNQWITYEWSSLATYPTPAREAPYTAPDSIVSEMRKAKAVASSATHQASHQIIMSICEWFNTYHPIWDVGLFRNTFSADPVSPTQPQPAYYVMRNMATILAETKPAPVAFDTAGTTESFQRATFDREGNPVAALWIDSGKPKKYSDVTLEGTGFVMAIGHETAATVDEAPDVEVTVRFPNQPATRAVAYDTINGLRQDLVVTRDGDAAVVKGLLAKDYPVFIELMK